MLTGILSEEHVMIKMALKNYQNGKINAMDFVEEVAEIVAKTDKEIKNNK